MIKMPSGYERGADGPPIVERLAIFFITIVAPVLLALHLLFDLIGLVYFVKVLFALLFLMRLPACWHRMMDDGFRSPLVWAAIFFVTELVITAYLLQGGSDVGSTGKIRGLLSATVWCSGIWLGVEYVPTPAAFRFAMRQLQWLGLLISGSAITSFLAHRAGVSFGETIETYEGNLRVFGPLGDNAPFLILFFFFLAFAQARWWWVLLHSIAILLSVGRGVTVAAGVGVAAYLCTPFLQRSQLPFLKRFTLLFRKGGMVVAIALLALSVTATGRFLASRFGDTTQLIYEDRLGGRLSNIEFAWDLIKSRPALGYGYYGYSEEAYRVYGNAMLDASNVEINSRSITSNATNQIVQTMVDGGIVTALCFLGIIYCLCLNIFRTIRLPELLERDHVVALGVYAISIFIGTQSAVYIIDQSSLGYFVFWIVGLFEAYRGIYLTGRGPAGPMARGIERTNV